MRSRIHVFALVALSGLFCTTYGRADDSASPEQPEFPAELKSFVEGATSLNQQETVYLDRKAKATYIESRVALQEGLLEMLCCPAQTKEHESVLSANCRAATVHTALLALGAEPGTPVQYNPEFQPPTGEVIEITLFWIDKKGKVRDVPAEDWVRTVTRRYFAADLKSLPPDVELSEDEDLIYDTRNQQLLHFGVMSEKAKKEFAERSDNKAYQEAIEMLHKAIQPQLLDADWVFAGSLFQEDPATGAKQYLADGGDMICVANFPSAMIDIAVKSSNVDSQRGYEANADAVPPLGTPVLIRLKRAADTKKKQPAQD